MAKHAEAFVDDAGNEWVRFGNDKLIPEAKPDEGPSPLTFVVTIRLTAAQIERQNILGPSLLPPYIPPAPR